jgi:hypothetical protein
VAFVPPNNSALRLRLVRTFAFAAIARTRARSFAGNLTLGLEAALAGLATLGSCFMLCLRFGATSRFDPHAFSSLSDRHSITLDQRGNPVA